MSSSSETIDGNNEGAAGSTPAPSRRKIAVQIGIAFAIVAALVALSSYVWGDEEQWRPALTNFLEQARGTPWALPIVIGAYIFGGLVFFPIILLNLIVAIVFGFWGIAYGLIGVMANTCLYFWIGSVWRKHGGQKFLSHPKVKWVDEKLQRVGLAGMVALHALPAPPFTIMNVIAGLSSVAAVTYLLGTFMAMLPGAIARGVVGESLTKILLNPTPESYMWLGGGIILWIVLVGGAHILLKKFQKEEQPKLPA